ncbi:MAG: antiviral reverse transcriptase Drt3b [Pseudomonadota bacterium]|nr:antiviral reverse transcriptase Drt3b [Pseudomonadota bacterium]
MRRKKINLKYRKERAILSDVLPFELPITFTNRHFYHFLMENKVEMKNGKISWLSGCSTLDHIICLLFGLAQNKRFSKIKKHIGSVEKEFNIYEVGNKASLIPFAYKINHKKAEFRELTVPHPRSQLEVVDFYDICKETITYHCSGSNFAIRKPVKVTKYKFHKDRTHYANLSEDDPLIEEDGQEYENLRSFFVYQNYSNIYKFYESYQYHRCEKKYNRLLKLDISKCFDSIYTHSLAWATMGKDYVKENLDASKETFAGKFDRLMQNMNYNETNGIIIGPEFSRIFAEILLQSVDKKVELQLHSEHRLKNRVDYEIFRYVDDYFIFYNEEDDKDRITDTLQHALKEYKLYLNSSKAVIYDKPLITEISMAKQKIANLLEEKIVYRTTEEDDGENKIIKGSVHIKSDKLITQFKTIIKECNVSYKDMLNYSLATVENKCDRMLKKYSKTTPEYRPKKQIIQAIISVLDFSFFIYSVAPKVNTTIRLCRIIRMFCSFLSAKSINSEHRHLIYKCIYDNACFILDKNKSSEHTQVETLYLLIALAELGKDYWLEESVLARYFNIEKVNERYQSKSKLNYLSYTVILFYMRDKVRYNDLRSYIENEIKRYFVDNKTLIGKKAELTMLLFDILTCPFVSESTKKHLLTLHDIQDNSAQGNILDFRSKDGQKQLWFTTWQNFNFGKELDTKQSQEVY